jgi:hypothetical protein
VALAEDAGNKGPTHSFVAARREILLDGATRRAERAIPNRDDIARRQGARSFGLGASLPLAKLYKSTARFADPRRPRAKAFRPTPSSSCSD